MKYEIIDKQTGKIVTNFKNPFVTPNGQLVEGYPTPTLESDQFKYLLTVSFRNHTWYEGQCYIHKLPLTPAYMRVVSFGEYKIWCKATYKYHVHYGWHVRLYENKNDEWKFYEYELLSGQVYDWFVGNIYQDKYNDILNYI